MKNLILLLLTVYSCLAWSSKNPITPCAFTLEELASLDQIHGSVFYTSHHNQFPSYNRLREQFEKTSPSEMKVIRAKLKAESGFAVEPLPVIMDKAVWELLKSAAAQRALAANKFLKDIYQSKSPLFLQKYPSFKPILESSPMFAHEIVGTEAAKKNPFDFTLAMDIILTDNADGSKGFSILEADSGSIGGNFRMAQVSQALEDAWPESNLKSDFLDARDGLFKRMELHSRNAKIRGGRSLLYTEQDPAFEPGSSSHLQEWLNKRGILIAGPWNKKDLKYNYLEKKYYFQGMPIKDLWLEYYTEPLDPLSPVYERVSEMIKSDPFEQSHMLPGFWGNWLNGGFRNWRQNNPQGIEVFTDKAIAAAISMSEKLYLGKQSQLKNLYSNILQDSPHATQKFINRVFADQAGTVIKSRRDSGQGSGVYIGRALYDGKTKNSLTWSDLKIQVEKNPLDWVYQPFMQEQPLILADGRRRTYEFRIITNVENGVPRVVDAVYIRSSAEGTMRNMSGTRELDDLDAPSIIPVLIPK